MTEKELYALAQSILVMIPHRNSEGINAGLMHAARSWAILGLDASTVEDNHGGFIEITRAGMARAFIEHARTRPRLQYLVMVDSDQSVDWDAPLRLAQWDLPIVAGVICSVNDSRGVFACFTVKDDCGVARFPSIRYTGRMPRRGLIEAHSVGTGLICIKKNVIETIMEHGDIPFKIPENVRDQSFDTGVLKQGEDIAFCRQAEEHGFKRYVDLSVHGVHYKTLAIRWPPDLVDRNLEASEWKVDSRDYAHVG